MLSKEMCTLLNKQIETEGQASQVYLAMASWAEVQGFSGVASFLYHHSEEERMHMLKLIHYINERGGHALVPNLKAVPTTFESVNQVFSSVLEHEVKVSNEINAVVDHCLKEKDYATHNFMQWYVTEQLEEEHLARTLLDKLNLIGTDKGGFYLFDRDLETLSKGETK
ncbi:ferritin [bacterium]|nr:ferritin [bacterium]